jgi:hypothetical protein
MTNEQKFLEFKKHVEFEFKCAEASYNNACHDGNEFTQNFHRSKMVALQGVLNAMPDLEF